MKIFQVTKNMPRFVLTPYEKAKINKRLKELNRTRRLNVAIAVQKAQKIFITR